MIIPIGGYVLITVLEFISFVLSLYKIVLLAAVLLSWFNVSPYNPLVHWIRQVTEPVLSAIRRILPDFGPVDLSPLIAFFAISLLQSALLRLGNRMISTLL